MTDDRTQAANLVQTLTTISPAHFRHVRHSMIEDVDAYLLAEAEPPLRDLARRSMTEAAIQLRPTDYQGHLRVVDVYRVARWLADAGEIFMTDAEGQQHIATPGLLYTWPKGDRPALGPRTMQRALYLLADLYAGHGPTEDRAKAYFYADQAERKDPYAAEMFGRRFDRWHHWEALQKSDLATLTVLMAGEKAAQEAFENYQREMSDGSSVLIPRGLSS